MTGTASLICRVVVGTRERFPPSLPLLPIAGNELTLLLPAATLRKVDPESTVELTLSMEVEVG